MHKEQSSLIELSTTLVSSIDKLRATLEEENSSLESGVALNHDSFISRKNQSLRELMSYQKHGDRLLGVPEVKAALQSVRTLVERNHQLLQAHVGAMSEISTLLTNVEIAEQADGTYSRSA